MKSIALDFKNKMICVMTEGQQGTEYMLELTKEQFFPYIPEKYRDYDSFTWNFQNDTFAINEDYDLEPGSIMTSAAFIPKLIIPMKRLGSHYNNFIELMGYEEISTQSIFDELLTEMFKLACEDYTTEESEE